MKTNIFELFNAIDTVEWFSGKSSLFENIKSRQGIQHIRYNSRLGTLKYYVDPEHAKKMLEMQKLYTRNLSDYVSMAPLGSLYEKNNNKN